MSAGDAVTVHACCVPNFRSQCHAPRILSFQVYRYSPSSTLHIYAAYPAVQIPTRNNSIPFQLLLQCCISPAGTGRIRSEV